jgi:hypothetical protein
MFENIEFHHRSPTIKIPKKDFYSIRVNDQWRIIFRCRAFIEAYAEPGRSTSGEKSIEGRSGERIQYFPEWRE